MAAHALSVLEFDAVKSRLAGHCQAPLAGLLVWEMLPSFDREEVARRQQLTQEAWALMGRESAPSLAEVADHRAAARRAAKGGTLDGLTLFQIGAALAAFRSLLALLKNKPSEYPGLYELALGLPDLPKTQEAIERSLDSGGDVMDSASAELARLRRHKRNTASRLTERIHSYTTGAHREFLSDPIVTQRGGRYVVPVRAEHKSRIRGIVHDSSASGQTVFVEPADVLELGNALREAEAAEQTEVARILANLSTRVGADGEAIALGLESAAVIDLALAQARFGAAMDGCLPEAATDARIMIERGTHPLLDRASAVPLTLDLDAENLLITGPNTGGKTVALKTIGLFVAMAQCGMMLPAHRAKVGFFSQIWADIGDEQSIQQSLSTFSGHIRNISEALRELQPNALVLLDEVGAGTDPAEGAALARAILLEIQARGAKVVASTHYGELKLFAANTPGFLNCSMEFDLKSLRPTYRLLVGTPGSSHALKIAERYGMPLSVIEAARADQGAEEAEIAKMLEQLEHAQRRAHKAQIEADRLAHRLKEVEREAEQKLTEAEEIRRNARQKVADAVDEEMRQIRLETAELFDQVKKSGGVIPDSTRKRLQQLNDRGVNIADRIRPLGDEPQGPVEVVAGMSVRLKGYSQIGVVLENPKGGKAPVQVGGLKMTVRVEHLTPEAPETPKREPRRSLELEKAQTARPELDLRGARAEDAQHELHTYLDDVTLAGMRQVRIVHGKGGGILRQVVHDALKAHRDVREWREGEPSEGGAGVTIVILR